MATAGSGWGKDLLSFLLSLPTRPPFVQTQRKLKLKGISKEWSRPRKSFPHKYWLLKKLLYHLTLIYWRYKERFKAGKQTGEEQERKLVFVERAYVCQTQFQIPHTFKIVQIASDRKPNSDGSCKKKRGGFIGIVPEKSRSKAAGSYIKTVKLPGLIEPTP